MIPDFWATDKMHEECGVFGVFSNHEHDTYTLSKFGLFSLQHRGQEAAGIATLSNVGHIKVHKAQGLVSEVFEKSLSSEFTGYASIGHVRYSTTGGSSSFNIQPLYVTDENKNIKLAIAHNGNLVNTHTIRAKLEQLGYTMMTTSDSEIILKLIFHYQKKMPIEEAVAKTCREIEGAFSFLVLSNDTLIAVRDANAIRPLCMGRRDNGIYVFSSETCGLSAVNASFEKFIDPAEMIIVRKGAPLRSILFTNTVNKKTCSFEYLYFSRPDSYIDNIFTYSVREECGRYLYKQRHIEADVVVGVPDSGVPAAIGYAAASNIPYKPLLVKNKYIGRSFIAPTQAERELLVNLKLNTIDKEIENKRVIVIDDSIVRGTTSSYIVNLFHKARAKEIHFLSAAPAIEYPCFLGIDTPSKENLISAQADKKGIAQKINVQSVEFLSLENLHHILDEHNFCYGCFSGRYPINNHST